MNFVRSQFLFFLLLVTVASGNVFEDTFKNRIYKAYVSNDMKQWKLVIDEMQQIKPKSVGLLPELMNYQYGYVAWCVGKSNTQEALLYYATANHTLFLLSKYYQHASTISAYQSALYSLEIGMSMLKAPVLLPKCIDAARGAIQADSTNWFAYVQYANIHYYTPALFGGSKAYAIKQYKIALKLMEQNKELTYNNWNYLHLIVTLAQAFEALELYASAKVMYEKALKIEPDFWWVKEKLYPALLVKYNQK